MSRRFPPERKRCMIYLRAVHYKILDWKVLRHQVLDVRAKHLHRRDERRRKPTRRRLFASGEREIYNVSCCDQNSKFLQTPGTAVRARRKSRATNSANRLERFLEEARRPSVVLDKARHLGAEYAGIPGRTGLMPLGTTYHRMRVHSSSSSSTAITRDRDVP